MESTRGPGSGHPAPAGLARRELDLFDLLALAWSQKLFILLVFLVLFIPMAGAAWVLLKPEYVAQSRLLVLLDPEDQAPGAAGSGGAFTLDQVLQSEAEILNSDTVRRLALERQGGSADPGSLKTLRQGFRVDRAPNASVLVARYAGENPVLAANALNAMIDAYLAYRREVLVEDGADALVERLGAAEIAAAVAETNLRTFLNEHGVVDFTAERLALITRVTELQSSLLAAEAAAMSARGGAGALQQRLQEIPQSVELYVENDVTGQLLALEVRRRELTARYQDDAPPVIAIDREIRALRDLVSSGGAEGAGQRRTGANPVYQELDSARLQREAEAAAQGRLAATLREQLREARAEADRLAALAPQYDRLSREAGSRAEAASRLALQSAAASSRRGGSSGIADSIRIVERATPPAEARSLRQAGIGAAGVLALGAALLAGLLRGYFIASRDPRAMARPAPMAASDSHDGFDELEEDIRPVPRPARQAASAGVQTLPRRPLAVLARVRDFGPYGAGQDARPV
ncbi:MAG: Wzz/FepE/Etk N-terminal domain-containing protein [Glycocaulis sp.]